MLAVGSVRRAVLRVIGRGAGQGRVTDTLNSKWLFRLASVAFAANLIALRAMSRGMHVPRSPTVAGVAFQRPWHGPYSASGWRDGWASAKAASCMQRW